MSNLKSAVERYLASNKSGSNRAGAQALSRIYRGGGRSAEGVDIGAYLAARLPATAAATSAVLAEIRRLRPFFEPRSMVDAGAGPGTASWMAVETWPNIASITMIDLHREFLETAKALAQQSGSEALAAAQFKHGDLCQLEGKADLVVAAYSLAEVSAKYLSSAVASLWKSASDTLVLIEPGTPTGFRRLQVARTQLMASGANMVAPCPHANACPIQTPDWCHFSVRLPRSRAHMHAKSAKLPFEDEKYCVLVISRVTEVLPPSRILRQPTHNKSGIRFELCTATGLVDAFIPRRDSRSYQQARKLCWGDTFAKTS